MRRCDSEEGQTPVFLASSRYALTRAYGRSGFLCIDAALRDLCSALAPRPGFLLYVDDEASTGPLGAGPVCARSASAVRALAEQLEANLGGQPGVLWLIGGHSVIPFFRVPNPSDDPDPSVLSDTPYGAPAGDTFRPLRAVGRLPHAGCSNGYAFAARITRAALSLRPRRSRSPKARPAGYTASVWREAAQEVFSVLGTGADLRMSPPWDCHDYSLVRVPQAGFRYYNLHGRPDGRAWHGQRDPALPAGYPDFPVAIRHLDISPSEAENAAVLTEACYGASLGAASIARRFLRLGVGALVGSTAMSYGAVSPPLTGADLLGREFLRHMLAGASAGEALLAARLSFARTMMAEQGFLDAEDQKTLLSFALLGNPLFAVPITRGKRQPGSAGEERPTDRGFEVRCAHSLPDPRPLLPSQSLLSELEYYASAIMSAWPPQAGLRQGTCSGIGLCRQERLSLGGGRVLALSHRLPTGELALAKVTFSGGQITKAVVSRGWA